MTAKTTANAATRLEKFIYRNGGHWSEIQHKNGNKYYVQRKGISGYERLRQDVFRILFNEKEIKRNLSWDELIDFLLNPVH